MAFDTYLTESIESEENDEINLEAPNEIAEEVGDKIKVGKINVDENQELAMEYEVMSIPTIIILQNGEVKNSFVGVREKEEIISCLEKMI